MKSIKVHQRERDDDLYIVTPDQYLMVWMKDCDEMIYRRPMNGHRISKNCSDPAMNQSQITKFIDDFKSTLDSENVAGFQLDSIYTSAIRDTIKISTATHVRFYSEGDVVKVIVFDLRKYVDVIGLPLSKNRCVYEKSIRGTQNVPVFSFSMRAETFLQLPVDGSDVEILRNGLGVFVGLEENLECFVRDQGIREPLIRFTNERLDREIVFLSHQRTIQT